MKRMSSLKAALAASVCLLPLQALAQSDDGFDIGEKPAAAAAPATPSNNWVSLGAQYNSGGSDYINRFTGAVHPGFYGLGDFHYGQRDAWDSGGTHYLELNGANLGMDDRSFDAKIGQQGNWGLDFSYEGIPYYAQDKFQSIYSSNGNLVSGVAPGSLALVYSPFLPAKGSLNSLWLPTYAKNPANLLNSQNLSMQRDIFKGDGKYQWGDWTISGGWRHEHKEGFQANSLEIGGAPSVTTAGTGSTKPTTFTTGLAYFAQPIDYDTDIYNVSAAYGGRVGQLQLDYVFSQFTDNTTTFNAPNPFDFVSSTLSTSYPSGIAGVQGIYVLPPSNDAHQFKGQFGLNITPTTRLNVNLGYELDLQNANYVSGTGVGANMSQTLPRTSFDGVMNNYFANVAVTSNPLPRFDVRVSYTLDDRSNGSPQNSYLVYPTSTANTTFNYMNLPFSYENQKGEVELGYRLAPQTKLTVTDTLSDTHRNYTDVSDVIANDIGAKLRGPVFDGLFASLSVGHEDRWANNYDSNGWWKAACQQCNSEPPNFLMFMEASMEHNEIKNTLDWSPTNAITVSLVTKYSIDTYPDNSYGMRNNNNLSIGPDVSWQLDANLSAHAYYMYQKIFYDQASLYSSGTVTPTSTGYFAPYNLNTSDQVQTVGVNLDWNAIPDRLKLSLDYNLSYGDTAYALGMGMVAVGGGVTSPTTGPSLTAQPLPNVTSMLSLISLHGEYKLATNISLLLGAAWERFSYKDYMNDAGSTSYADALLPGTFNPNESVVMASAAVRFRF